MIEMIIHKIIVNITKAKIQEFCAIIEEGNEEICLDDGYEDGQNNTYSENRSEWYEFWGNEYDEGFTLGSEN